MRRALCGLIATVALSGCGVVNALPYIAAGLDIAKETAPCVEVITSPTGKSLGANPACLPTFKTIGASVTGGAANDTSSK